MTELVRRGENPAPSGQEDYCSEELNPTVNSGGLSQSGYGVRKA
jgi:hypothetical protein